MGNDQEKEEKAFTGGKETSISDHIQSEKKTYETPQLIQLGDVAKLTNSFDVSVSAY
jgi:hypothetical protein